MACSKILHFTLIISFLRVTNLSHVCSVCVVHKVLSPQGEVERGGQKPEVLKFWIQTKNGRTGASATWYFNHVKNTDNNTTQ